MAQVLASERQRAPETYRLAHPVRLVTAAALFDGHDAAINIMRRLLQASGAEIVHLGHNRGVAEIVAAAVEEDVQGVAITSYQGGHLEFFTYLRRLLDERGAGDVRIYGGGGGSDRPFGDRRAPPAGHRPHLLARGRPSHGAAGDDRRRPRGVRLRSRREAARRARGAVPATGPRHHPRRAGPQASRDPLGQRARSASGRTRRRRSGGRPHRYRRGGQEQPDRRAGAALRRRLPRQARGGAVRRPHQASDRRRPARRPHPLQHRQTPAGLPALAGHSRRPRRGVGGVARRRRHRPGERRLRSHPPRDGGHRPGRQRRRRARATSRST